MVTYTVKSPFQNLFSQIELFFMIALSVDTGLGSRAWERTLVSLAVNGIGDLKIEEQGLAPI